MGTDSDGEVIDVMLRTFGDIWRMWNRGNSVEIGTGGCGMRHVIIGNSPTLTDALQSAVSFGYWD